MSQFQKSILFNTSAGTDVQYVGGEILIPGLDPIKQSRVIDFSQVNYRAEVSQVVTVGATAYTPTASTRYIVTIGDVSRRNHGLTEAPFMYAYTTPDDITTLGATAALQREAITLALVAKINAVTYNYVVAATLTLGNGFTITDDAGYYPVNAQGMTNRLGASTVKLMTDSDGRGFAITNVALTTAAVYSSGVGANLVTAAPVFDLVYTNLISGYVDGPKTIAGATAVSGQKYNMFSVTYLADSNLPTIGSAYSGFVSKTQQVWVDNGAGSATTNLAGYIALERAMHRGIAVKYNNDPSAIAEFFDNNFVIQGSLGAVPATTADLKNKLFTGYANMFNHHNIGTQTIVAPTQGATGLLIEQDATATEGAHYCAEVATSCPKEFVVGKQEVTFVFKASATTVANIVLLAGLRKKEAYAANFNDYNELVAGGTGPSGTDLYTYGILGGAATVATDSTLNAVNSTEFTVLIKVAKSGLVAMYINDTKVNVYSAGTTALTFVAGTVLIPFFQYTNLNSAAAVPNVTEMLALPSYNVYYN